MLDYQKYMDIAAQIAEELITHPSCLKYVSLQQKINEDQTALQYKNRFVKAKLAYEEVQQYGAKFHPDYKTVSKELIEAKTALYEYPLIKAFKSCEREIEQLLKETSAQIAKMGEIEGKLEKKEHQCGGHCS